MTTIRTSTRSVPALLDGLASWLARTLPQDADPMVTSAADDTSRGMSSETVLFDLAWTEDSARRTGGFVARFAPDPADLPLFPAYDLDRQYRAMRAVRANSTVPAPDAVWCEPDPAAIGAPFLVMRRIDGVVPRDNPSYAFTESWLRSANSDQQRTLQESTVDVLAALHAIDEPISTFSFLEIEEPGADHLQRHISRTLSWYAFASQDGHRSPLLDAAFRWLVDHRPSDPSPTVLSWGDSRIGNVMYEAFRPVAVLDWEMAALGPRELDVSWLIHGHRLYQEFGMRRGGVGMPDFLTAPDVCARYEQVAGVRLQDMDFYLTYSAIQYAVILLRAGVRMVHFGEREMPEDIDDLVLNRGPLTQMLAGEYW
jgi:aminoglycoside phosphotransferase (APT) family kinase protein